MLNIQNLFCNILFVIMPYLLTEIFFQRNPQRAKISLATLSFISIVICMNFPILSSKDLLFDLRSIPLLFAILYGGWKIGISLLVFIVSYRFNFGQSGVYINLVSYLLLLAALFPFKSYYPNLSLNKKIRFTIAFALFHSMAIIGLHFLTGILDPSILWLRAAIMITVTGFITILIEKYQENQVIRETIHQSEKLQAISEIAASVSHEIRNPMTVVRGFIQLILQDKIPEKYATYLTLSMAELDRAEKIINDYLAYARPQMDQFEVIPLENELEHVGSILGPYATLHGVEIIVKRGHHANVWGDRLKLRQALLNLVKNGIESMPQGGVLKLTLQRNNDQVSIMIKDSGVGMTKDQIQRLGTPFYSLKEKGTGLGTMVSYRVIESMKGNISIHSEVGKGSLFIITFPIYKQERV